MSLREGDLTQDNEGKRSSLLVTSEKAIVNEQKDPTVAPCLIKIESGVQQPEPEQQHTFVVSQVRKPSVNPLAVRSLDTVLRNFQNN